MLNCLGSSAYLPVDSCRALIFSRFLSENLDLKFLSMFLNSRCELEELLNTKFAMISMQQRTSTTASLPLSDVRRSPNMLSTSPILNPIRSQSAGNILSKVRTFQNNAEGIPRILNSSSPMKNRTSERTDGQLLDEKNSGGNEGSIARNGNMRHVTNNKDQRDAHEISKSVFHISDYTVPEAPSIGFDFSLLPLVCSALLPQGKEHHQIEIC